MVPTAELSPLTQTQRLVAHHMAALAATDADLVRHSSAVADYAMVIADRLGWSHVLRAELYLAGMLHDVGKTCIDPAILHAPGRLSREQWIEMRSHVELGLKLLEGTVSPVVIRYIAGHHERVDGTGYPRLLGAGEISVGSKILAFADSFDAMTSSRCYRAAMTFHRAIEEVRACSGTQFDSDVAGAAWATFADGLLVPGCGLDDDRAQTVPADGLGHVRVAARGKSFGGGRAFRLA